MEHNLPLKADSFSGSQEIPCLLRHSIVLYSTQNNPQLVPVLRQINPVYTLLIYILKVPFNIILQSKPKSSKWSLRLLHQNHVRISPLPCTCHVPHATPIPFILICSPGQYFVTSRDHDALYCTVPFILLLSRPA